MDTNFGLESFEVFAARHRDVRRDVLRERYDKAVEAKKQEQIRENAAARQLRLDAEAKTKREREALREAEAHERARAHEQKLKEHARGAWAGTAESFEAAWPQMKEKMLIADAIKAERAARESMRQQYVGNF
jgi:hypothetical protein